MTCYPRRVGTRRSGVLPATQASADGAPNATVRGSSAWRRTPINPVQPGTSPGLARCGQATAQVSSPPSVREGRPITVTTSGADGAHPEEPARSGTSPAVPAARGRSAAPTHGAAGHAGQQRADGDADRQVDRGGVHKPSEPSGSQRSPAVHRSRRSQGRPAATSPGATSAERYARRA